MSEPVTEQTSDVASKEKGPAKVMTLDELLQKREKAIARLRAKITASVFEMADQLAEAETLLGKGDLYNFGAYTCGLEASEITMLKTVRQRLGDHRDLCKQAGVGLAGLKALSSASKAIREEALVAMRNGTRLKSTDIRLLKQQAKAAEETPEVQLAKARKAAFASALRDRSRNAFARVTSKAEELFAAMAPCFADEFASAADEQHRAEIIGLAKEVLALLQEAIDVEDLPQAWERQGAETDDAHLGRAYDALVALSEGAFQEVDDEGRPFEEEFEIDRVIYKAISWLAGKPYELKRPTTFGPQASPLLKAPERDLVVLEICAGAGGQKLGLNAAGFRTIAAYEFDGHAALTLRQHSTSVAPRVHEADIRDVDFSYFKGKVDLVAGGVPCQPFSEAGQRGGENDERDLFQEAVRVVDEVRPRAFFFENVTGFAKRNAAAYRRKLHAAFKALGYDSQIFHFYGADYGLGQARPRVAFIGFRNGLMPRFKMPDVVPRRSRSLVDAIGDLVKANGWKGYDAWAAAANRIAPTLVGGSKSSGKYAFGSNFTKDTWASFGIDSRSLAAEAPGPAHEGLFRLTLRMGARLQGFPDDYEFKGSQMSQKSQIANALPPVMAKMVGLAIHSVLTGTSYDYEAAMDEPILTPSPKQRKPNVRNLNGDRRLDDEHVFFKETPRIDGLWPWETKEIELQYLEPEHSWDGDRSKVFGKGRRSDVPTSKDEAVADELGS